MSLNHTTVFWSSYKTGGSQPGPVTGNKISGTTRNANQNITLRVNRTNYVVTSDSNKYFELDVTGITITSLSQLLFSNVNRVNLVTIDFDIDSSSCTLMDRMFYNCTYLTSVTFTNFDTSNVTNFSQAFRNCSRLTSLDVSSLNTSNVTNMSYMFSGCGITSLDVSDLNTSNVTNMSFMFSGCGSLTSITGIDSLDVESVTTMESMFANCTSLTGLDLYDWSPISCTTFYYMFTGCTSLVGVALFAGTVSATNMSGMFNNCSAIEYLLPLGFDTSSVTDMSYMFYGCTSLVEVDLRSFDTTNAVSSMSSYFIPDLSTITVDYDSTKFYSSIVQTYSNVNWVDVS